MNRGTYGYPLPPNYATRAEPPVWTNVLLITATTSTQRVPANVFQMGVAVWGAGGGMNTTNAVCVSGGGGGGFAFGIVDVTPGQLLPTIITGNKLTVLTAHQLFPLGGC